MTRRASPPPPPRPPTKGRTTIVVAALSLAVAVALAITFRPVGPGSAAAPPTQSTAAPAPERYGYRVVNSYPHDPDAFTQGLLYRDGFLFESTGREGHSTLRKVRVETGEVVQSIALDDRYFAEGLADWGNRLIQLTWQANIGFVYALDTFEQERTFSYDGEGWGLARDGQRLIMSDGSSTLRFLDPETLQETGRLPVTERGLPVTLLNELEMVRGELFANIWQTDEVVIIDPSTGFVKARIDFRGLRSRLDTSRPIDVFNGIAWDDAAERLFVTGKWWPQLFEVRIDRN